VPEAPPWDSGLEPLELDEALGLLAALLLELELLLLLHAATAARATAATAAIPPVAALLVSIWGFLSDGFSYSVLPCPRRPAGTTSLDRTAKKPSTRTARMTTSRAPPATGPYW
jgi:hypothetical protein